MPRDTSTGSGHALTQWPVQYTLHDYEPSPYETAVGCSTQMSPQCLNNDPAIANAHIYAVLETSEENASLQTKPSTGFNGLSTSDCEGHTTDSKSFTQPNMNTPGNKTCATGAVGTSQPK